MLTREQVYTLLMLRNREGIFRALPVNVIQEISDCGQDPKNAISKALTHASKSLMIVSPSLIFCLTTKQAFTKMLAPYSRITLNRKAN